MAKRLHLMPRVFRRWRRRWPSNFQSPWVRLAAWLELQCVDHGFLRPFYNRPEKVADDVYRSNHPSPALIRRLSRRGFKSVISLRGRDCSGPFLFEQEACAQENMTLHAIRFYSKRPPTISKIKRFAQLMASVEQPVLMHCKSGADRSGLAAALYLLIEGRGTVAQAKAHLSWRYLHIKQARTGILDSFLEQYDEFNQKTPIPFMDWVEHHYDPAALKRDFKPRGWANWIVDGILRRE